jgi:glycine cleavage system H protein
MAADYPEQLRYTTSDEWVRQDGNEMVSGITSFAAEQLGDVVYVQLPDADNHFDTGATYGEIESVKAVSDLYFPLAGTVVAVNEELDQNPGLVNDDPYGEGWMLRFRPDNPTDYDSLLSAADYEQSTKDRS